MLLVGIKTRNHGPKPADEPAPDLPGERAGLVVENPDASAKQVPTRWHPQYGLYLGWPVLGLVLAITGLVGLAFVTEMNLLLLWAASMATAILIVSMVLPGRMIYPVEITRDLPDNGVVAEPMTIKYHIRNTRKYFPIYSLRLIELIEPDKSVAIPRIYIPYIGPGQTCSFQVLITPNVRGQIEFKGTRLASRYPFGLLTRFRTCPDGRKIAIYPALGKIKGRFLPGQRQIDLQSGHARSRFHGGGDEFYALREYRRGDSIRLIHWKRSARMGQLLVREMTQFAPQRLTVILDTYLPESSAKTRMQFEQAVSFVATLLCYSLDAGYRVALICATTPPVIVPPQAGREVQHRLLRTLSQLEAQDTTQLTDQIRNWRWASRWRGRCLLVGLTDYGPALADRLAEEIGPVRQLLVGSSQWARAFLPPVHPGPQEVDR